MVTQRPITCGKQIPGAPFAVRALLKELVGFHVELGAVLGAFVHVSTVVVIVLPVPEPGELSGILAIGELWPHQLADVILKRIMLCSPFIYQGSVFNGLFVAVHAVFKLTPVNLNGITHAPLWRIGSVIVCNGGRCEGKAGDAN